MCPRRKRVPVERQPRRAANGPMKSEAEGGQDQERGHEAQKTRESESWSGVWVLRRERLCQNRKYRPGAGQRSCYWAEGKLFARIVADGDDHLQSCYLWEGGRCQLSKSSPAPL